MNWQWLAGTGQSHRSRRRDQRSDRSVLADVPGSRLVRDHLPGPGPDPAGGLRLRRIRPQPRAGAPAGSRSDKRPRPQEKLQVRRRLYVDQPGSRKPMANVAAGSSKGSVHSSTNGSQRGGLARRGLAGHAARRQAATGRTAFFRARNNS